MSKRKTLQLLFRQELQLADVDTKSMFVRFPNWHKSRLRNFARALCSFVRQ